MKTQLRKLFWLTCIMVVSANCFSQTLFTGTNITFGMNGHPLTSRSYYIIPISQQLQMLKNNNIKYYRIDVLTDSLGKVILKPEILDTLCTAAKAAGIELVPVFYTKNLKYTDDPQIAYDKGYAMGNGFAKKYKKYITYYELANETDIPLKTAQIGTSKAAFRAHDSQVVTTYLKGLNDGIKAAYSGAKTIIDFTKFNYGYLSFFKDANVNFDIVASHWYNSSGYKESEYSSVIKGIKSIYPNKKIWITEFNHAEGSFKKDPVHQRQWIVD